MINNKDVIIIGGNHHNTLGVIRGLGYEGIKPILILIAGDNEDTYVDKSSYIKTCIRVAHDNDIINVIKHEYVHYYLVETTNENHKHDALFKRKCAEIGCTHDKTRNYLESDYNEKAQFKYEVWCDDCGLIGTYSRMCKTLKTLDYCKCGICNKTGLKMIQNW